MKKKTVIISRKKFTLFGEAKDTYFADFLKEGKTFYDVPIAFIEKFCPEDGVVFDLGANIGAVFCSASVVASKGKVYAFEASKRIHDYAARAIKENSLSNVELYNIALSNRKGTLSFYEDPTFLAGSRVAKEGAPHSNKVKALRLDTLVKSINPAKIDIMKIDVEGFEEEVLKGARKTIKKYKPLCLIEFNTYALIALNRQLPQDFMKVLQKMFPRIYAFDRTTAGIYEITDKTDDFIKQNLLNGCVDDVICTFGDLPDSGDWFKRHNK